MFVLQSPPDSTKLSILKTQVKFCTGRRTTATHSSSCPFVAWKFRFPACISGFDVDAGTVMAMVEMKAWKVRTYGRTICPAM